ncbi:MAG: hypothetical protein HY692_05195 [Cyanobacteria bacterium NC_groundwater_1444_Ag_S-0.65um_54_12]|nr:hypothetical protein [Cyanobacteria bacterium NC_groundwater_1444_Ag_S-0.65um_54_12]
MLKLKRRCIVADDLGRKYEFRIVTVLPDGTLIMLTAKCAEEIRLLAAANLSVDVLRILRDNIVALDPETGCFLCLAELKKRLESVANPLLKLVAISA